MSEKPVETPNFVDLTEGREFVINGIAAGGYWGSQHVICLLSSRVGVGPDGALRNESAIVARLRLDNDMALQLRDALSKATSALRPPPNERAN